MSGEVPEVLGFINGILTTCYLVAAVFFLKFWRRTGERLFAAFAAAFALLGVAQPVPMLTGAEDEAQAVIYLARLAAFALIIAAILMKNFTSRRD
jgi:hypothetical protein